MSVQYAQKHRFTVDEFHRMAETGILSPDDRVELIDGEIVEMTPIGSRHAACVAGLDDLFRDLLGRTVTIFVQNPLQLENEQQPNPDVSVLRRREDRYAGQLPTAADALLVVEVSDSSVLLNRNVKSRRYARAGIAELWVVDLTRSSVLVCREPNAGEYRELAEYQLGQSFVSPALGGREVRVEDVLGPAARG